MAVPRYVPASLAELHRLSDEILYLARDESVDSSWYTKRLGLSSVYAATEVFMTTDTSKDFRETESFLDRRLEDGRTLRGAAGSVGEWVGFSAMGVVNGLRSKGVRI